MADPQTSVSQYLVYALTVGIIIIKVFLIRLFRRNNQTNQQLQTMQKSMQRFSIQGIDQEIVQALKNGGLVGEEINIQDNNKKNGQEKQQQQEEEEKKNSVIKTLYERYKIQPSFLLKSEQQVRTKNFIEEQNTLVLNLEPQLRRSESV